nr:MAG TPA: hypothetical protein [Caudoviricetes sp.]
MAPIPENTPQQTDDRRAARTARQPPRCVTTTSKIRSSRERAASLPINIRRRKRTHADHATPLYLQQITR